MTWNKFTEVKPPEDTQLVFLIRTVILPGWCDDGTHLYGYVHSTGQWNATTGVSIDAFKKHDPRDAQYIAEMVVLYWLELPSDPVMLPALNKDRKESSVIKS